MIDRPIQQQLSRNRPFCLLGAIGTGKTTLLKQFSTGFSNVIHLDLETLADRQLFNDTQDVYEVLRGISFLKDKELRGSGTLLIMDEIGRCPASANWVRQILGQQKQDLSDDSRKNKTMPFIAAISSVRSKEVETLTDPVNGCMTAIPVHPFSFGEFLMAIGDKPSLDAFRETPVPSYAYKKLLDLFHLYALIGGMPGVINTYAEERRLTGLKRNYRQTEEGFQALLSVFAPGERSRSLASEVMANIYPYAAMRIKFNGFGNTNRGSRDIAGAMRMLEELFILHMVYPYTSTTYGTLADKNKSPRLQIVDSGLVSYFSGIQKPLFGSHDMNAIFEGQVARQVVGQEMLVTAEGADGVPGFWVRHKAQSTAEVDFVVPFGELLIPVSVRSGEPGRLRSLHQFVDAAPHSFAVRLSAGPLNVQQTRTMKGKNYFLMNLPYFLAGRIREHLRGFVKFIST